jgi:hypothetical protein
MTSIWDDLSKNNEELSAALKNVKATLNR